MKALLIAIVFHGLDLLTGLIGAVKNKDVESAKMRDGLFKKAGFLICYFVAFLIDKYGVDLGLQVGVKVLPVFILYGVVTEIISIVENIQVINPDLLPEKLLKMFHIKKEGEQE